MVSRGVRDTTFFALKRLVLIIDLPLPTVWYVINCIFSPPMYCVYALILCVWITCCKQNKAVTKQIKTNSKQNENNWNQTNKTKQNYQNCSKTKAKQTIKTKRTEANKIEAKQNNNKTKAFMNRNKWNLIFSDFCPFHSIFTQTQVFALEFFT